MAAKGRHLHIDYRVTQAGDLTIPARSAAPSRRDNLWQGTCAELFVGAADQHYREFNFSPSGDWAAYDFHDYRERAADLPVVLAPAIEVACVDDQLTIAVRIACDDLPAPPAACRLGITLVLADGAGRLSYWALAHPAEKPDFHDRRGFILPGTSLINP